MVGGLKSWLKVKNVILFNNIDVMYLYLIFVVLKLSNKIVGKKFYYGILELLLSLIKDKNM